MPAAYREGYPEDGVFSLGTAQPVQQLATCLS